MERVAIIAAKRTATGKYGGTLKNIPAAELGTIIVKDLIKELSLEGKEVDEVLFGCVLKANMGGNPARQVVIKAGLPETVPAATFDKQCASAMKAITVGAASIMLGDADVVITGGMESMSKAPYLIPKARWGYRMGSGVIEDHMLKDGLICAICNYHMGITAENVAKKYGISRHEQDEFALISQQKTQVAIESGNFKDEIIPVIVPQKKHKKSIIFDTDETPRFGTTLEILSKLKTAFIKEEDGGTVTAGNSSGINDAASGVVLMSELKAKELGYKPMAFIKSYASAGVDPAYMGLGPIPATKKALKKAGLNIGDIELFEVNEAFAAQSIVVVRELGISTDILNVNGGAIALGHPIGSSGARIVVTLVQEMIKRDLHLGLATLCIGGGQGMTVILER